MKKPYGDEAWFTPNDGVRYLNPDVHGGDLQAPIGFLHWAWQFKPAPASKRKASARKTAPKRRRATTDNCRSRR